MPADSISCSPAFLYAGHGVALMGCKFPAGRDQRSRQPKATAMLRGIVGRKPEAEVGLDEQESNTRLTCWGKAALDADAQYSFGHHVSKSGEARRQVRF